MYKLSNNSTPRMVVFCVGAHATFGESLIKSIKKNDELLARHDTFSPAPKNYRALLRAARDKLNGSPASIETQDVLLAGMVGDDFIERLILSTPDLLAMPEWAIDEGLIYRKAGLRVQQMRNLFPDSKVHIYMAIQSPVKWIKRLYNVSKRAFSPSQIPHISPEKTRWISPIRDIVASNPDISLNVWRDEDAPFIWPGIMREVAGLEFGTNMFGGLDVYSKSTTKEGTKRLRAYMAANPPRSEFQRMRVAQAFYEKYYYDSKKFAEPHTMTWTNEIVNDFESCYLEDCRHISQLPGVNFIDAS